jgi:signal peptidase II
MTSLPLFRIVALVGLAVLVADQLTKWWVVEVMGLEHRFVIPVLPPLLTLKMAWNTGINFGLFGGGSDVTRWILVAISVAVSAALVWWVLRRQSVQMALGAGLVLGGAIGNAIDRVRHGAVADFLNTSCCGIDNPFSFNIADIAIFLGAVWIALKA